MTNYFEKITAESMMLSESEEVEIRTIAKQIETLIFAERRAGGTRVSIESAVYKNRVFRYFLSKELLRKNFMVEPISGVMDNYMKVSWCNEDILDLHRTARLERLEAMVSDASGAPSKKRHACENAEKPSFPSFSFGTPSNISFGGLDSEHTLTHQQETLFGEEKKHAKRTKKN